MGLGTKIKEALRSDGKDYEEDHPPGSFPKESGNRADEYAHQYLNNPPAGAKQSQTHQGTSTMQTGTGQGVGTGHDSRKNHLLDRSSDEENTAPRQGPEHDDGTAGYSHNKLHKPDDPRGFSSKEQGATAGTAAAATGATGYGLYQDKQTGPETAASGNEQYTQGARKQRDSAVDMGGIPGDKTSYEDQRAEFPDPGGMYKDEGASHFIKPQQGTQSLSQTQGTGVSDSGYGKSGQMTDQKADQPDQSKHGHSYDTAAAGLGAAGVAYGLSSKDSHAKGQDKGAGTGATGARTTLDDVTRGGVGQQQPTSVHAPSGGIYNTVVGSGSGQDDSAGREHMHHHQDKNQTSTAAAPSGVGNTTVWQARQTQQGPSQPGSMAKTTGRGQGAYYTPSSTDDSGKFQGHGLAAAGMGAGAGSAAGAGLAAERARGDQQKQKEMSSLVAMGSQAGQTQGGKQAFDAGPATPPQASPTTHVGPNSPAVMQSSRQDQSSATGGFGGIGGGQSSEKNIKPASLTTTQREDTAGFSPERRSLDDKGNTTGSSLTPSGGFVPGMGSDHYGPGHEGAKVMHTCQHCGKDNDISQYFKKDVVYRLGH